MDIKIFNEVVDWLNSDDMQKDAEIKECNEGWIISRGGLTRKEIVRNGARHRNKLQMRVARAKKRQNKQPKPKPVSKQPSIIEPLQDVLDCLKSIN